MTSKEYNLPVSLGCQNTADSEHKPHSQVLRSRKCNSNYSQKPYGEEKDIIALWRQLPSLLYFEAQVQRTDKSLSYPCPTWTREVFSHRRPLAVSVLG